MTRDQAKSFLEENQVKFVLAQFVDIHGVAKTKSVPVSHFEDILNDGAGFAGFAVWGLGQEPHDPDFMAVGDLSTLTLIPWQPGYARIVCNGRVRGEPYRYDTRYILEQQIDRLNQKGWTLNTGLEPEFMLLVKNPDGSLRPADDSDTLDKPCYDYKGLSRSRSFLEKLVGALQATGFDVYQIDHEDANGQFEINFTYSSAMTTADRYVLFRMAAGEIAREFGMICTFMPKPMSNRTGTGCHMHLSIADSQGTNLFKDDSDKNNLGLSPTGLSLPGRAAGSCSRFGRAGGALGQLLQTSGGRTLIVRGNLGACLYLLWRQQPNVDGSCALRTFGTALVRLQLQSLPGHSSSHCRRPGWDREKDGPRSTAQHQPLQAQPERTRGIGDWYSSPEHPGCNP